MPDSEVIILGSRSPRRRELLESVAGAIALRVMPPLSSAEADFQNVHDDLSIERRLLEIVRVKYADVCRQVQESGSPSPLIVVADTIVIASDNDGSRRVLGQPEPDHWQSDVRDWLRFWLAGRTHEVWTGVIVARHTESHEFVVKSKVTFCEISDATIEWYLSTNESPGKAGGYAIQGHAAAFVSQLSGSLTNVIGLPLLEVVEALQSLGWRLPGVGAKGAG